MMSLFTEPIAIDGIWRLGMLLPLALTISVVYKTLHCPRLRDLPRAALALWVTIVAGMMAFGVALMLAYNALA